MSQKLVEHGWDPPFLVGARQNSLSNAARTRSIGRIERARRQRRLERFFSGARQFQKEGRAGRRKVIAGRRPGNQAFGGYSYEEFTRLAETRLAQNCSNYS